MTTYIKKIKIKITFQSIFYIKLDTGLLLLFLRIDWAPPELSSHYAVARFQPVLDILIHYFHQFLREVSKWWVLCCIESNTITISSDFYTDYKWLDLWPDFDSINFPLLSWTHRVKLIISTSYIPIQYTLQFQNTLTF